MERRMPKPKVRIERKSAVIQLQGDRAAVVETRKGKKGLTVSGTREALEEINYLLCGQCKSGNKKRESRVRPGTDIEQMNCRPRQRTLVLCKLVGGTKIDYDEGKNR